MINLMITIDANIAAQIVNSLTCQSVTHSKVESHRIKQSMGRTVDWDANY